MRKKIGADAIYILPSSVSELLIVDAKALGRDGMEELYPIVCSVNATLRGEELLTDNVYYYNDGCVTDYHGNMYFPD